MTSTTSSWTRLTLRTTETSDGPSSTSWKVKREDPEYRLHCTPQYCLPEVLQAPQADARPSVWRIEGPRLRLGRPIHPLKAVAYVRTLRSRDRHAHRSE